MIDGLTYANSVRTLRGLLMVGVATIVPFGGLRAQTASDTNAPAATIETIVVTSERRGEQSVLDVPMAVDAFSSQTLKDYQVNSLTDITKLDSSVTVVNFGAGQQRIAIDGISSTATAATGIYMDESPLLGPYFGNIPGDGTPSLRLHDLDHVEVLKGPQGTLFGASSMDGTLRVVTAKPDLETLSGNADVTGAGVDGVGLFNADATLNVPIIGDKVGIRLVGWTEQGGGYINKIYTATGTTVPHANDTSLVGGRASLRLELIDHLTIDASLNMQTISVPGPQYVTTQVGAAGTPSNVARPAGAGTYANFDPTKDFDNEHYQLYSTVADYDLGFGDAIASGSYGRKVLSDATDTSATVCNSSVAYCLGSPYGYPSIFTRYVIYSDKTAEFRFSSKFDGPLQLVAGAYYENTNQNYNGAALQTSLVSGTPPMPDLLVPACRKVWSMPALAKVP